MNKIILVSWLLSLVQRPCIGRNSARSGRFESGLYFGTRFSLGLAHAADTGAIVWFSFTDVIHDQSDFRGSDCRMVRISVIVLDQLSLFAISNNYGY